MKKAIQLAKITMLALALAQLSSAALAEEPWVQSAKKLFEADEYEKCIDLTEPYVKQNIGAMFLAFSHLQEHIFNQTHFDNEKFKSYRMRLEAKTTVDDIKDLLYFVNQTDKPEVVIEARKLAKETFKGISEIEIIPKLVNFLSAEDEDSQELALAAIKRIIEPMRSYVSKGGTLRPKDIRIMRSERLIIPLLDRIDKRDALNALLEIEEPVLRFTNDYEGESIVKLESKIQKAVAKRQKRYPASNWYSAVGKDVN